MPYVIDQNSVQLMMSLYPDFRVRLIRVLNDVYNQTGMSMRVTSSLRSIEEQAKIYAQGRTTPGPIVTQAKPGSSFHNYGVAADCCFVGKDPFLENHGQAEGLWKSYGEFCK